MVDITWEDVENHVGKGDLKEWLKEERAKDKARQLSEDADTPQTDVYDYKGNGKWERSE